MNGISNNLEWNKFIKMIKLKKMFCENFWVPSAKEKREI